MTLGGGKKVMDISKKETYLTNAPKENKITIDNDGNFPNLKNVTGDSVNEHKNLEEANLIIAQKELGQQNENNAL